MMSHLIKIYTVCPLVFDFSVCYSLDLTFFEICGRQFCRLLFGSLRVKVSDDGSKPEVLSRIAQATAALTKLKPIWRDNNISLGSKVKLMRSLVISIFLYACESWTLTAELEKKTQAFEMRCYSRLLNISYKDHVTNEEVRRKIQAAIWGI